MEPIKIFFSGYAGRMGRAITGIIDEMDDMVIVAGSDKVASAASFPTFTNAADGVDCDFDVIIDFSHVSAWQDVAKLASVTGKPIVLCTTGYDETVKKEIAELSCSTPIFFSGNMSLGINLLTVLAKKAAQLLYPEFDIEIVEAHHNKKIDAPSGTALMLADAVNEVLDKDLEYVYERQSVRQARGKKELGLHAIRGGSIIGDHSVIFAGPEETITLSHSAQSRLVFARGAIAAARFMASKKEPGLFDMSDIVGTW